MSTVSERSKKRKQAIDTLKDLVSNAEHTLIIHYSCESFYDNKDGKTPRITSIAIRYFKTAQTKSFSIQNVAERKNIEFSRIENDYDMLEKEMLKEFFAFVKSHKAFKWIHWNMQDIYFAVEKLEREIGLMARALRKAEDLSNKTAKEIQEIEDKEPHRKIKDLNSLINYMKTKTSDALFKANFSKFRTSSSTLAEYILTELQLPKLSAGISITHGMDLQVEHIMPKTPSGRRINEWQHVRNEPEFKHYLTRLGNLMILEGDLNRACNNKIFQTKLNEYKNSKLTIPKQFHNDYTTGTWSSKTPIEREKAWNFNTIEIRQLKMAEEAINIWKY